MFASNVALEPIAGESQLVVRPNRDRLARFGIPVAQVMALVEDAIGGARAGQVIRGNERYDILVRLAPRYRASPDAIGDLILTAVNGAWVRLRDLAEVSIEPGPPQIRRDDVQRITGATAWPAYVPICALGLVCVFAALPCDAHPHAF